MLYTQFKQSVFLFLPTYTLFTAIQNNIWQNYKNTRVRTHYAIDARQETSFY